MAGVTKVELESVDGYALSGKIKIKLNKQGEPIVDKVENANNIITFSAVNESGFIAGKEYSILTLPCDLYGGYRLSIYKDGLVAHYFGVHQIVERAVYIAPNDLVEQELVFGDVNAPLVEEERPELDATTSALLVEYQKNPTAENKKELLNQMGIRYDKVVARKKAKLRELKREAKTQSLIDEMQGIVDEMVANRDIRLEQQFLRLIDPRTDDNPKKLYLNFRNNLFMLYKNTPSWCLWFILLFRMLLDGVAALKMLFERNTAGVKAVWKAHGAFRRSGSRLRKQRKELKRKYKPRWHTEQEHFSFIISKVMWGA